MKNHSPTVLCIMDGWGLNSSKLGNAIALAETPNYDDLLSNNGNPASRNQRRPVVVNEISIQSDSYGSRSTDHVTFL